MAGSFWIKLPGLAALACGLCALAGLLDGQAANGTLAGRLTDLYSKPLENAEVTLRNTATGAESRTITQKNGAYRITGLGPGEYTLAVNSPAEGHGELDGILVTAGREARVQAALAMEAARARPELPANSVALNPPVSSLEQSPATAAVKAPPREMPPRSAETASAPQPLADPVQRWLPPQPSQMPEAERTVPQGAVASQRLRSLPLAGRLLPPAEMPQVTIAAVTAELDTDKLDQMRLPTRNMDAPPSRPPAAANPASPSMQGESSPLLGASGLGDADTTAQLADQLAMAANPGLPAGGVLEVATAAKPAALQQLAAAAKGVALPGDETPAEATRFSADQLQSLPAGGRRWQDFALDAAGVPGESTGLSADSSAGKGVPLGVTEDGGNQSPAFGGESGGGRGNYAQGGTSETSASGAGQSAMGQAWAGGHGAAITEAAIRAVTIPANAMEAGGRLAVETERGSKQLHGQGFFTDRQNSWGAQNPFSTWVKETAPASPGFTPTFSAVPYTPPDHETTWGLGLGGQIKRDKLYWFAAADTYARNDPGLATVKHSDLFFQQPKDPQMTLLAAQLALSAADPADEGVAAYSQLLETLGGLLGPTARTAAQQTAFARLDWQATERQRLTLEGTGALWNSPGGGLARVNEAYGSHSFGSSRASHALFMGRWEGYLTQNLLFASQVSAGREILDSAPSTPSSYEQSLLAANVWGQLPQIVVDSAHGFTIGNPSRFGQGSYPDERQLQALGSLDWARGKLLLRSGFGFDHITDSTSLLRNQTGTYYYANAVDFASDALAFAKFGISGELNPYNFHDCDEVGHLWYGSAGVLRGLGALPCYSYYSQTMGPTDWWLGTNDWAAYSTAQWKPANRVVVSAGLRWEREQMPPPIGSLLNTALPMTETVPATGNQWGPRIGVAIGGSESRWPVLRLAYGMYFGRVENGTLETALTQTGSLKGDLNFFVRPTDALNDVNKTSGAAAFPYVFEGEPLGVVKPGAVEFAARFRNPQIHQSLVSMEQRLPGRIELTASAEASLGRRLPISIDTNIDPAVNPQTITYAVVDASGVGPLKSPQVTVPFYADWPSATSGTGFAGRLNAGYQQITQIESRANSTYEAASLRLSRNTRRGLSLNARYTYSHAMDWNPNESTQVAGSDVLDPGNFKQEYGVGNLDLRHTASFFAIYDTPWKLPGLAGKLLDGWMLSGIGQFHSGLPFTMRTSGALAKEFTVNGTAIVALGPGMNGSGGDNRVYGVGRNTYRYPSTWKADLRIARRFNLGAMRQLELLAESFNLFNHQNVTELETTGYTISAGSPGTLPTLNYLTGLKANTTAFGQPLNVSATNFYRERQIQLGMRMRF